MRSRYIVTTEYNSLDRQFNGPFELERARVFLAERASMETSEIDDSEYDELEESGDLEHTQDYFNLAGGLEIRIWPEDSINLQFMPDGK